MMTRFACNLFHLSEALVLPLFSVMNVVACFEV